MVTKLRLSLTVCIFLLICLATLVWQSPLASYPSSSKRKVANPHTASISQSQDNDHQQEARLLSHIRQLTFAGRRAGEGYFSQDGSMLVFQSERTPENPFFQIYLMNLQTGGTRRVSPGYGKTTCGWIHPNREKVLFASTHNDPNARLKQKKELDLRTSGKARRYSWDFDEYFDIFETDLYGDQLKNLTHTLGYDAEASWSPDGRLIIFASNRHAYAEKLPAQDQATFEHDKSVMVDLYLMNANGTQVRRLTQTKGYDGGPFFSPDGKKICWRRFSPDGTTAEIFIMNTDGTAEKQLTHLGVMSWAPYFHPSGDYLIFATNLEGMGNFELYLVDARGKSEPVRVTYTDGFDGLPVFSPDGKWFSWTSSRAAEKQSQIFLADWNDTEARRLLGLEVKENPLPTAMPVSPSPPRDLTPTVPEVNANDLRLHITHLASDEMEGRLTGTEGERRATDYVASVFQSLGLEPAGDRGTFFQPFEFTAGVSLGPENQLTLSKGGISSRQGYKVDKDWRPLAFSQTGGFGPAEIVFAGYGLVAPATDEHNEYDAFAHLDVTDKWVLVFRYLPEEISSEWRQHLARHASLRYKAMVARDRGARGLLVVSGPNSKVKDELVRLSFDASLAGTSIAALSVTDDLAGQLLQPSGKGLKELQDALDTGKSVMGFSIPDLLLRVTVDIQQEKRRGRNVLARLNAAGNAKRAAVVVGAHVDHLGHGSGAGSLARGDESGKIHYGADDNASGVAGVLEIAQYLVDQKAKEELPLRRDVLFALWSGEELGLLGSSYFTRTFSDKETEPSTLAPNLAAYLNMDMIGRLDKTLILQGIGSSSIWPQEIERANVPTGLPIVANNDSYLPTDATAFYLKSVPILSAFTGAHEDYHTPGDTADKINYAGAEKITRLMALLTRSLITREDIPDYLVMEKPSSSGRRANLRASLGTIPDYAQSNAVGVKLAGVAKGGPSDQAGVEGGDIIVGLAGQKIENIYDYTYTIEALKVGVAVEMIVVRGDQSLKLTVTPESRE